MTLLFANSAQAIAQQRPPDLKTVAGSINFVWKDIEHDFIALADAMPEEKWNFRPTQGEFTGVRTFADRSSTSLTQTRVGRKIAGGKPPQRYATGGSKSHSAVIVLRFVLRIPITCHLRLPQKGQLLVNF
jgi:hypothetical protein